MLLSGEDMVHTIFDVDIERCQFVCIKCFTVIELLIDFCPDLSWSGSTRWGIWLPRLLFHFISFSLIGALVWQLLWCWNYWEDSVKRFELSVISELLSSVFVFQMKLLYCVALCVCPFSFSWCSWAIFNHDLYNSRGLILFMRVVKPSTLSSV